ncbi:hypothetical protein KC851_00065 [Candidatus Kaiserbacteria bacterium]|nr:hypothetical protein [Candidatus Kaiserbacteria bacterium]
MFKKTLLIFTLFFSITLTTFAQVSSDSFRVRFYGAADVTPPTTPILLSVTPVSPNQIDLSWSSSTDDYILFGYEIIRGSTTIATTNQLIYSDTGLTPSTTYGYTVRAFDYSYNYSTSSNYIAATTLGLPPDPVEESASPDGTAARSVLRSLNIYEGVSTTSLLAKTAKPTRLEIRWGKTDAYELGYVVSGVYQSEHSFLLTDLEPGTTYEYEVIGYMPHSPETFLRKGTFTTLEEKDYVPPANVARFLAVADGYNVDLSWQLPTEEVAYVRIVRSHYSYPEHPLDGAVVYQGRDTKITDEAALLRYSPIYYTAFVYDSAGNVSSGAIATVYLTGEAKTPIIDYTNPPEIVPEATSSVTDRFVEGMKMPNLSDIYVTQGELIRTLDNAHIKLNSQDSFLITVPAKTVAGNLKSIIATILDPTDTRKSYSFLLKRTGDRSAYQAAVPALSVLGASQLRVEIYDYEAFVVGNYQTPIQFSEKTDESVVFEDRLANIIKLSAAAVLILLLILIILAILFRKQTEDKQTETV